MNSLCVQQVCFSPIVILVFALSGTFMVCCMAGSSIYSINSEKIKGEKLAVICFVAASISMAMIAFSSSSTMKFLAMNLFEMTVGMYWPIMGTMKGVIVPESHRAAIYNLFRIPLNFIVLFSLLTDLTPAQSFGLNAVMLATAAGLQLVLMKRRELTGQTSASASRSTSRSPSRSDSQLDGTPLLEKNDASV
jgi:hypothetical protein